MLFDAQPAPMRGFTSRRPKCGICALYKKCRSPKIPVVGKGKRGILIVGEAPGKSEDKRGQPFVGPSGKRLTDTLLRLGISIRDDCWLTNAVICKPTAMNPTDNQVEYCRPNLLNTIRELKPKVIILLGGVAVQSLMPHIWRSTDIGGISRWAGFQIPCRTLNAWVCPTYHPAHVLRSDSEPGGRAVSDQFTRHVARGASHSTHPYDGDPPDEPGEVEIVIDPDEAARIIRSEMNKGGLTAFDYETTCLKPDSSAAEIVSCAICFRGERTVAYPWHGAAIEATKRYLRSPLPKVGQNCKFEHRWTLAKLGIHVRNWVWDSMLASHVLDCRRGITSVKFQAFVRLGVPIWDNGVKQYIQSDGPNQPNRLRQCPLDTLLRYNGVDALVEYKVALELSRELGIELPKE